MSNNAETYERITNQIVSLIDSDGLLPWQKPWNGTAEFARSMSSGKLYNGINRWVLTLTAQANGWSPWFGTYKQITELGGQVRKGEKSSTAILWKPVKKVVDGVEDSFLILRTFNVFSASQADGLPEKFYAKPEGNDFELDLDAQGVFDAYTEAYGIPVSYGGGQAFYQPKADSITLPLVETFKGSAEFHATAFHEAAHSTGHASRLNRPGVVDFDHFGSHNYSREELVAELGSALVLGALGLDNPKLIENQAAYLKSWKSALKDDPQAIVWAAGRAEKAANLILGLEEVAA